MVYANGIEYQDYGGIIHEYFILNHHCVRLLKQPDVCTRSNRLAS